MAALDSIGIVGAGGWGTALAITLAQQAETIRLWVFEPDLCEALRRTRVNAVYLPGPLLPANVYPTGDLEKALRGAEMVIAAVPSQHVRGLCERMRPLLGPEQVLVSATKGLECGTLLRMSEVIAQTLAPRFRPRLAVLSGPSFAPEVARGRPTALVIASPDEPLARRIQQQLSHAAFRLYTNTDVPGVEMGGAVKNVIAIAAGVCDGLGLGANAIAALVTRGLSEIARLACACGGHRETLAGLSGLGDLVLTCTGTQSRNRTLGTELAKGRPLQEILQSMRMVAEGVNTTAVTLQLARQKGIEMAITEQMHGLLFHGRSAEDAVRELMARTLKAE